MKCCGEPQRAIRRRATPRRIEPSHVTIRFDEDTEEGNHRKESTNQVTGEFRIDQSSHRQDLNQPIKSQPTSESTNQVTVALPNRIDIANRTIYTQAATRSTALLHESRTKRPDTQVQQGHVQ